MLKKCTGEQQPQQVKVINASDLITLLILHLQQQAKLEENVSFAMAQGHLQLHRK